MEGPEKHNVADDGPESKHTEITTVEEVKSETVERARDVRDMLARYVRRHLPEKTETPIRSAPEPPRTSSGHDRFLPLLRLVPVILMVGFGASFAWDFDGISLSLFGRTLALDGLLRIVSVSGLIGFLTNWLAITMLFNPRQQRPIFGRGLIPAQRERVIYRLATAVSEELINEEIIAAKIEESQVIPRYRQMAVDVARGVIEDEDFRQELKLMASDYMNKVLASDEVRARIVDFTVEKLETRLGEGISGLALKVYRFLNEDDFRNKLDQTVQEIPKSLDNVLDEMDHLLDRVPEKIEARSEDIERWATQVILGFVENIDIYSMIMENMSAYDEGQLEDLLKKSSNEQLNYIKYLGGILGCLGGLVIWRPLLSLGFFAVVGGTLYAIDEIIFRANRKGKK